MSDPRIEGLEPMDERQCDSRQAWEEWEAEACRRWDALDAILSAYRESLRRELTIPTMLAAAIEAARRQNEH